MKLDSTALRASHVNIGTSVPHDELPWPKTEGRVMRAPKLHAEIDERSIVTPYGGLDLFMQFVRRFRVAQKIDASVEVLKFHFPYHESDHVLAQAMNLYVGGTCIEDMARLQESEAILRMTGACRLPDPTTGGDFLRRFDEERNPGSLAGLRGAIDEIQQEVWSALAKRRGRKRTRRTWGLIDVDSHVKEFYSEQKEEADFSYNGKWSYHPLLVSLGETGENLAIQNRPGNAHSAEGSAKIVGKVLARVKPHFDKILVRGDSAFDVHELRETCEEHGAYFSFAGKAFSNRPGIAYTIPKSQWRPFDSRIRRRRKEQQNRSTYKPRGKKRNRRDRVARKRGYRQMRLTRQWITEVPWKHKDSSKSYRLIIRKQIIKHTKGQQFLFDDERYFYIVTNLPSSMTAEEIVDWLYHRCDQENVIEQMKNGLVAWKMPVAEFAGNSAWLEIARLAWNIAKWIAQLALAPEVVRWEWKRFRQAFVYVAATVIRRARSLWVRFSDSHRFTRTLVGAHNKLQT